MKNSKIEVRSRDVNWIPSIPFKGVPQHLFIVYTDHAGKETILRGGPVESMVYGDIQIIKANYTEGSVDWISNAPSIEIARGTDAEMQALVDKMWAHPKVTATKSAT